MNGTVQYESKQVWIIATDLDKIEGFLCLCSTL